jgi:hypothetical protein
MPPRLRNDLARLGSLAFHRIEKSGDAVRAYHRHAKKLQRHPDFHVLEKVYKWLFAPLTLWPIDVQGLVIHLIVALRNPGKIDQRTRLLAELLGEVPAVEVQQAVATQEFLVQEGNYEQLIRSQLKFDEIEEKLATHPRFRKEWKLIESEWNVAKFANRSGVVRRRTVQERNFRTDWEFGWEGEQEQFQIVLDAFCHRWDLYGMLGDKPLLLKLSVNLTPHGTLIMVPSYWSFDARRDLKWKAISKLHRARGIQRQGPKMSSNRRDRRKQAAKAKTLWGEVCALGFRGTKRNHWVMDRMGWHPATDESKLKRLLKL